MSSVPVPADRPPMESAEDLDDPRELVHALWQAAYSAGIGVFVYEPSTSRILWNDAMFEVYGVDRASFDHNVSTWLGYVHPEDMARVEADVRAALRGERPYDTVFRIRQPDGDWRYVKGTAWVERDANGRPIRMAGVNLDVTDRYRFHSLVEAIQSGTSTEVGTSFFQSLVATLTKTLRVRYAFVTEVYPSEAPTHARVVAASHDGELCHVDDYALAGTPCGEVLFDQVCLFARDVQKLFPEDQALVELKAESYLGVRLRRSDGTVIGMVVVIDDKPMHDSELTSKLMLIFAGRAGAELQRLQHEDEVSRLNQELEARVTVRTGEVKRAMRELEAFTYSVSHDLSAPLRAIQGFGTILSDDYAAGLDEAGRHYLERLLGAADRMGRLLDDLVSLSKISLRALNVGKVDLSKLAQDILADLQMQSPRPNMVVSLAPQLVLHADAGLMRLLLDCLLRNAWHFTAKVELPRIELSERFNNGRREIFVRDNGVGFDVEGARNLFAPFQTFHGEGSLTGSGTGLAIAQRVVHRHHGGIDAESQPGAGATFYFWLPGPAEMMSLIESERG
ncbi:sensor histidine kinase [Chitinimonas lacunae]|uniref:histidine kinase n=1 Tax=Chitinimonas lacunae TaxID=1963018 RepID=A0ABV8MTC9_9NEIS